MFRTEWVNKFLEMEKITQSKTFEDLLYGERGLCMVNHIGFATLFQIDQTTFMCSRVFDFWNFFQINFKHYTKGALDPIDIKCERIFQNGPSKLNLFKF